MMRSILLCSLLLLVAGCQAQAVKPESAPAVAKAPVDPLAPIQGRFDEMAKSNAQVAERITLMQEQVIKLNQHMQAIQQRNLQLLQALQQMQLRQAQVKSTADKELESQSGDDAKDEVPTLVKQLQQMLAEQNNRPSGGAKASSGGPATGFKLVSAYTPKGQWVIFKYDEATGLSWTARDGGWDEVNELESMPLSVYQVILRPAAGDVKGYVAARIDRETGQTWWLKGNGWEPFQ
ncbi:MAG: hypothetical protein V7739_02935 [Motiliproteus sp.]